MKPTTRTETAKQRLEYLRGELRAERISCGELAELHYLKAHIEPGDVELLEAAGVPEFPDNDAKYTPGPWRIESSGTDGNTGFFKFKISAETGQEILETRVHVLGTTYDQILANARLIAAAPELLEACQNLIFKINNKQRPTNDDMNQASAAIARATRGNMIATVLFGTRAGNEDWQEELLSECPERFEAAKKWAIGQGFDPAKFRVADIDLGKPPDFGKTVRV